GRVATFFDTDTSVSADKFTATITWGDGHTSAGTIQPLDIGPPIVEPGFHILPPWPAPHFQIFEVIGTNTYDHGGTFPVSVTIDDSVNNLTADAQSTPRVEDETNATLHVRGIDVNATAGHAFTGLV